MACGVMTEDESGYWGGLEAETLGDDWNATIIGDFDDGALTPDEGLLRTSWDGAQDGTFFFFGDGPGLLRWHLEFAVEFVSVACLH